MNTGETIHNSATERHRSNLMECKEFVTSKQKTPEYWLKKGTPERFNEIFNALVDATKQSLTDWQKELKIRLKNEGKQVLKLEIDNNFRKPISECLDWYQSNSEIIKKFGFDSVYKDIRFVMEQTIREIEMYFNALPVDHFEQQLFLYNCLTKNLSRSQIKNKLLEMYHFDTSLIDAFVSENSKTIPIKRDKHPVNQPQNRLLTLYEIWQIMQEFGDEMNKRNPEPEPKPQQKQNKGGRPKAEVRPFNKLLHTTKPNELAEVLKREFKDTEPRNIVLMIEALKYSDTNANAIIKDPYNNAIYKSVWSYFGLGQYTDANLNNHKRNLNKSEITACRGVINKLINNIR